MNCPVCQEELIDPQDVTPNATPRPGQAGDLGICPQCRSWLWFDSATQIRKLTDYEWLMMSDARRRMLTQLRDRVLR